MTFTSNELVELVLDLQLKVRELEKRLRVIEQKDHPDVIKAMQPEGCIFREGWE